MTKQMMSPLEGRPALPVIEQMESDVQFALQPRSDSPPPVVALLDHIRALPNINTKAFQLDYAGCDGKPGRFVASPTLWLRQVHIATATSNELGLRRLYQEALAEYEADRQAVRGVSAV